MALNILPGSRGRDGVGTLSLENVERLAPVDENLTPPTLPEVASVTDPVVEQMRGEAVNWGFQTASINQLLDQWVTTAPQDMGLSKGTVCSGIGLSVNDGPTVYRVERKVGANPSAEQPRVFKFNGGQEQVGRITGPGRMGGPFGYTTDGQAIVGTLASFAHNFIVSLLGYWDRPSLPYDGGWQLPNLVLPETRAPDQFHPDAGFTFRTRPAARTNFVVVVQSPTPATVAFDVWDGPQGESVVRHQGVDVPAGETQVVLRTGFLPPSSGVFNVVVLDAPEGLTVTEVRTQPISF